MMKLMKSGASKAALMVLCLAAASAATSQPARAQAAQTLTIGIVDEDKMGVSYTKYKDAMARLEQRAKALDEQLKARELMDAGEGKRFDGLVVKTNRGKGDEDALQSLTKSGMDRRAEFIKLSGNPARSEADTAKMRKMQQQANENQAALRAIADTLYGSLKKQQDDMDKQYTEQAKNVIAQIASEKKLSMVVRQRAVIWSAPAIDITDEVLSRLNKS